MGWGSGGAAQRRPTCGRGASASMSLGALPLPRLCDPSERMDVTSHGGDDEDCKVVGEQSLLSGMYLHAW